MYHRYLFIRFLYYFLRYASGVYPVFLGILFLICCGATLISWTDELEFSNAIYLAFVTAFTIGYGDFVPISAAAKITSLLIALMGIIFTGLIVAISTKALMSAIDETK